MPRHDYDTVATRFIDRLTRGDHLKLLRNERMYPSANGDVLYSYGSHFELVRALRGRKGNLTAFLLNGDSYSVTTSRHQSAVRDAVARASHIPSVIIPYSALHAAGIDLATIELVETLPDRWETYERTYTEVQPGWQWRDVPEYAYRHQTTEELQAIADHKTARALEQWEQHERWAEEDGPDGFWAKRREPRPDPVTIADLPDWEKRHLVRYIERTERRLFTSHLGHREVEILDDGRYRLTWSRHWLGESLIRAVVPETRRLTCKDCGGTGWAPPNTTGLVGCTRCSFWPDERQGRGSIHQTRRRRALFLSGFDHNETRNLYFFSELPNLKPGTVAEAYEALKPDTVRLAEQMGREVHRQGDIFAVPLLGLDRRTLRGMGATFEKRGGLLGTNHVATEVARLRDGRTLARGTLTHAPQFRRPDHKRVTLPKGVWHLTLKNTVPISR